MWVLNDQEVSHRLLDPNRPLSIRLMPLMKCKIHRLSIGLEGMLCGESMRS